MATAHKPRMTLSPLRPLLDVDRIDDEPRPPPLLEAPRMALNLIDEDPDQPRTEFDAQSLRELADNIKASGGVKSPVSLRPHPTSPGRFMLNFGSRRLRASRLLDLPDIPYFVDRRVDSFDQVSENEQRQGLTAMELAMFIKARLGEGMQQQDIARRLGKSKALVSKATSLIDAPDAVMEAYRAGKLQTVNEAYALRRLHEEYPQAVAAWAAVQSEITCTKLEQLRAELLLRAAPVPAPVPAEPDAAMQQAGAKVLAATGTAPKPIAAGTPVKAPSRACAAATPSTASAVTPVLMGEYKGQPLELDVTACPSAEGHVFGRRPGSPRRLTVPAAAVRLIGFAR